MCCTKTESLLMCSEHDDVCGHGVDKNFRQIIIVLPGSSQTVFTVLTFCNY